MIYKASILLFAMVLGGCQQMSQKKSQYIPDHSKDYLKSSVIAHLKVPAGLSQPLDTDTYPMPTTIPPLSDLKNVSLEPPGFGKL